MLDGKNEPVCHPWFPSLVVGFPANWLPYFLTRTKKPRMSAGVEITEASLQPVGSTSGKRNNGKSQQRVFGQCQLSQTD
jgi:hypothetical protein